MRDWARLCADLDAHADPAAQVQAVHRYLASAEPADAAWGLHLLLGWRPARALTPAALRQHGMAVSGLSAWLVAVSEQAVGDWAETLALLLPPPKLPDRLGLATWMTQRVLPLMALPPADRTQPLAAWWDGLQADERFVLNQCLGGVAQHRLPRAVLQQALAAWADVDLSLMALRMAQWTRQVHTPQAGDCQALLAPSHRAPDAAPAAVGQPLPFAPLHWPALASAQGPPLLQAPGPLWAEGLYDGLRAQVVVQAGQVWVWSPTQALWNDHFPEVLAWAHSLPDGTVLDGVLVAWQAGQAATGLAVRQRLQRKAIGRAVAARAPVRFLAFDALMLANDDLRAQPLQARRDRLEGLLASQPGHLSMRFNPQGPRHALDMQAQSRSLGLAGWVIKRADAAYADVPPKTASAVWQAWPAEALLAHLVLAYAQFKPAGPTGPGVEYTLAAWSQPPQDGTEVDRFMHDLARGIAPDAQGLRLVPVVKLQGGLPTADLQQIDDRARQTVLQKFGPVRSLRPSLVLQVAFDGVAASRRHACGLVLQGARLTGLRLDMTLSDATPLQALQGHLRP